MDALPIEEISGVSFASQTSGKMHACGHDGHTTMLLGAARHLSETRDFDGTAVLIFQPAEEGLGGARQMIADGLFEKFPVDEIYGMHNSPNGRPGTFDICKGVAMAGAMFFDAHIRGVGSHAAMPQQSRDAVWLPQPLLANCKALSAEMLLRLKAVFCSSRLHAGAYNVVPETAHCRTVRYF